MIQPGGAQEQQEMEAEQEMRLQCRPKVHLGDRTGDKATCSIGPRSTYAQGGQKGTERDTGKVTA